MNKAITEGLVLMPPRFIDGLDAFSTVNGRPGDPVYQAGSAAALVSGDVDFGDCAEFLKTEVVQAIRSTAETPVEPGLYLQIRVRVKAVGGPRPSARIACHVTNASGAEITDVQTAGTSVFLEDYNAPYTLTAIVGVGNRPGVDLAWGPQAAIAHVGIDFLGDTNGYIRVEDISVEDVTDVFHTLMIGRFDVRDFGAIGDGVTDDTDAFIAADAVAFAQGKELFVSAGSYFLAGNVTIDARCRFEGTLSSASTGLISFTRSYDFNTYADAFGDEEEALRRALGALFNFTDHDSLDLCGRKIALYEPIDVYAATQGVDTLAVRRVVRNGLIEAKASTAWEDGVTSATASYSTGNPFTLSGISNAAAIAVGSLVTGQGVGREVYVTSVDAALGTVTISQPLYGATASQSYTFTRFQYLLDFSGFTRLSRLELLNIEFLGSGLASGVMLAPDGIASHVKDCWFVRPAARGITSIGTGCNGLTIESNEFLSPDSAENAVDRISVGFNTNSNDMKIRNNRVLRFRHFGVMAGGGHLILGNHWFQGDSVAVDAGRTAGIILTQGSSKTTITGNYIDNCWIELTNEHDATPATGSSFGKLTIASNIFTCSDVPTSFNYIRLAPYASGLQLDGLSVTGNAFKSLNGGVIERVEAVDTSHGSFDAAMTRNVTFADNSYEDVLFRTAAPLLLDHVQVSVADIWTLNTGGRLPFEGRAMVAYGLSMNGAVRDSGGAVYDGIPYLEPQSGIGLDEVRLRWVKAVKGNALIMVRSDLSF